MSANIIDRARERKASTIADVLEDIGVMEFEDFAERIADLSQDVRNLAGEIAADRNGIRHPSPPSDHTWRLVGLILRERARAREVA